MKKLLSQIPVDLQDDGNLLNMQGENLLNRLMCDKHQANGEKFSRLGNAKDSIEPLTEDAMTSLVSDMLTTIV